MNQMLLTRYGTGFLLVFTILLTESV